MNFEKDSVIELVEQRRIIIQTHKGENILIVNPSNTIKEIKNMITNKEEFFDNNDYKNQNLRFHGITLEVDCTLEKYNIQNNDKLILSHFKLLIKTTSGDALVLNLNDSSSTINDLKAI